MGLKEDSLGCAAQGRHGGTPDKSFGEACLLGCKEDGPRSRNSGAPTDGRPYRVFIRGIAYWPHSELERVTTELNLC